MLKRGWIIGAFALVAVIALAGWIRKPAEAPAPAYFSPTPVPATWDQPAANFAAPTPYGAAPMVYGSAPAAPQATAAPRQQASTRSYTPAERRYGVKKRPFSHSAAIVGGSAGAGAAIGALAGGGKGAAIGAISGGAAGLIYDRATNKKRVPVE